uniref:L1 transposable element RRM domain-containing protein n=1 Tax=Latimeria chalumnae TaxID=7897 RepID=H3AWH9_LATCH
LSPTSSSNEASDMVPIQPELIVPSENISEDIKMILTSIRQISTTIGDIKQSNKDILGRLTSIEAHLSDSDGRLTAAEAQIVALTSAVSDLHPSRFLEETLPALLKLPEGTELSIERAHRSLAPRPALGQRPCPFLIKLLRFPVKELPLKSAREIGALDWEGHRILVFPDLSKALQDRRRQFLPVKKILREKKAKYGLFYPAMLQVTYKGETLSFGMVEDVEKLVK